MKTEAQVRAELERLKQVKYLAEISTFPIPQEVANLEGNIYALRWVLITEEAEMAADNDATYVYRPATNAAIRDLYNLTADNKKDVFWNCWVEGTSGGLHHKHPTLEEARKEAARLAERNKGRKVYVMECVSYCEALERPIITWTVFPRWYYQTAT